MAIGGGSAGQTFDEINVTPLTDVFLVLLVIMILIAPIIDKSDLKIKPPETRNAKKDDASRGISIDIDDKGHISINSKQMPTGASVPELQAKIDSFIKQVGKSADSVPVTVNADGDAKQKDVVEIMSAAAACGIKKMRVATYQRNGG
ncbi:MAG TPA: biopolymer transporter ExbD [Candidatus Obscuribacterales bacterium]